MNSVSTSQINHFRAKPISSRTVDFGLEIKFERRKNVKKSTWDRLKIETFVVNKKKFIYIKNVQFKFFKTKS